MNHFAIRNLLSDGYILQGPVINDKKGDSHPIFDRTTLAIRLPHHRTPHPTVHLPYLGDRLAVLVEEHHVEQQFGCGSAKELMLYHEPEKGGDQRLKIIVG